MLSGHYNTMRRVCVKYSAGLQPTTPFIHHKSLTPVGRERDSFCPQLWNGGGVSVIERCDSRTLISVIKVCPSLVLTSAHWLSRYLSPSSLLREWRINHEILIEFHLQFVSHHSIMCTNNCIFGKECISFLPLFQTTLLCCALLNTPLAPRLLSEEG